MPSGARFPAEPMETLFTAPTFNDTLSKDASSSNTVCNSPSGCHEQSTQPITQILHYRHPPVSYIPTAHKISAHFVDLQLPNPCPTVYALTKRHIFAYRPPSTCWNSIAKLPAPRRRHAAVYFHGRIYVAGGLDEHAKYCKSFWSCDAAAGDKPSAADWFTEQPLPRPLGDFHLLAAHVQIYALGAAGTAALLRYDPAISRHWTSLQRMRRQRIGAAVTRHRNWLVVAGGRNADTGEILRSIEAYDLVAGRWKWWPPLRVARVYAKAYSVVIRRRMKEGAAMKDRDGEDAGDANGVAILCICGGIGDDGKRLGTIDELSAVAVKDEDELQPAQVITRKDGEHSETPRWRSVGKMQHARSHHSVAVLGAQVLIVGGRLENPHAENAGTFLIEGFCHERRAWIAGIAQVPMESTTDVCGAFTDF